MQTIETCALTRCRPSRNDGTISIDYGKRTEHHVESAADEFQDLLSRYPFPDVKPKIRMAPMQTSYDRRHEIRTESRRHAETNGCGNSVRSTSRYVPKILNNHKRLSRALGNLAARRSQLGS